MRRVNCQESRVESQKLRFGRRSFSGSRLSTLDPRLSRSGVTLVELLITILIISILAALVLGVAAVAGQTAREAQTRHMITRLHALLMEQYGTYKTRRVKLRERQGNVPGVEELIQNGIPLGSPNGAMRRGAALAEARLYALREMMVMEMPDRWSDVLLMTVGGSDTGPPQSTSIPPLYLAGRTDLSNIYWRRYLRLVGRTNTLTGSDNTAGDIRANQGAECLYMIITLATGDGEARSQFGEKDIGDTDGDGAPEFLDAWGRPIEFLRWAPGFDSLIQFNANALDNPPAGITREQAWAEASEHDRDPFDLFRLESPRRETSAGSVQRPPPYAFRLVPLIYSGGRDESAGLFTQPELVTWRWNTPGITFTNNRGGPFLAPALIPHMKGSGNLPMHYLGTDLNAVNASVEKTTADNIHNHLLGRR